MSKKRIGMYEVNATLMKQMYYALITANDNAIESYNHHMAEVGERSLTRRDKCVRNFLKKDIAIVGDLLNKFQENKWEFEI